MAETEKVVIVTEESLRRKEAAALKAAARAKALEGLTFPLLVVATHKDGVFYGGHRIRQGRTFTCAKAEDYSANCMKPAPAAAVDQTEQARRAAPVRTRRSGEGGDPEPQKSVTAAQAASGKSVI